MDYSRQSNKLTLPARLGRSFLKRFMYSQLAVFSGFNIAFGKGNPLISFRVETDPPSIYWAFRIRPSERENLEQELDLPGHFSLCPVRCLATEEPDYWMVVNAYRVSGLANGIRAEWSVFVRDTLGVPRYMVIDARSSKRSMDPVSIITPATTVVHEKAGRVIHTQIGDGHDAFRSTINLPEQPRHAGISPDWVSANDYIYWRNGIRDRSFYNAALANSPPLHLGRADCELTDGSVWGRFVETAPAHILVLTRPVELIISPWENVDTVHRP